MSYKQICSVIGKSLADIITDLRNADRIYLFGVNQYTGFIINKARQLGCLFDGIIDNDKNKQGQIIRRTKVLSINETNFQNSVVLIASGYYEEMRAQLAAYCKNINVISLFDFTAYNKLVYHNNEYWCDDVFDDNLKKLELGEKVYKFLADGSLLIISPTVSVGDHFLWNIYFDEYLEENKIRDYRIVVASGAAKRVIELFGRKKIDVILVDEIDALCDYVLYEGEKKTNSLVIYPRYGVVRYADVIADWNGLSWQRIYAEYIFQLKIVRCRFPDIYDAGITENDLIKKGMVRKQTVILSPYANTVGELPLYFWEELVDVLIRRGYAAYTNVAGDQVAIRNTHPLYIPFKGCGNFLEYAGLFISIRNGLCDITGKAKCQKIIIYNNTRQLFATERFYNNLEIDGIADNAKYVINEIGQEDHTLMKVISLIDRKGN